MISVKVIAVSLLDVPARKNGDRLIASFDAEIAAAVRIRSCSLVRQSNGDHFTSLPSFLGRNGRSASSGRRVEITDPELRSRVTKAAVAALRSITGEERA